jgi:anaerobic selenocysteine-containing dehydrogenase
MCACRCGIRVHLRDGVVRYIDGNPDHPLEQGRDLRQGLVGHHEAVLPGAPAEAA